MIKEMKLMNVEIEGGEKNIVAQNSQGKILKILFNPTNVNSGVRLKIFTKEGEMILNVTQKGLYYPRANISSEKSEDYAFAREADRKDYYYFKDRLLFNITANEEFEGIVIDELVLMYLDIRPVNNRNEIISLTMAVQEIAIQNGEVNGRG